MTGVSDYASRVPYFRDRYARRRGYVREQQRDYRDRCAPEIALAGILGTSIPAARRTLAQLRTSDRQGRFMP